MRLVFLVLAAGALLPAGCSYLITRGGKDVTPFATREQVRAEFGVPAMTGDQGGQPYDEFVTRRKVSDPLLESAHALALHVTFGLGEVILLPIALYESGYRLAVGRRLRFEYDGAGNVRSVTFGGKRLFHKMAPDEPAPPSQNP